MSGLVKGYCLMVWSRISCAAILGDTGCALNKEAVPVIILRLVNRGQCRGSADFLRWWRIGSVRFPSGLWLKLLSFFVLLLLEKYQTRIFWHRILDSNCPWHRLLDGNYPKASWLVLAVTAILIQMLFIHFTPVVLYLHESSHILLDVWLVRLFAFIRRPATNAFISIAK